MAFPEVKLNTPVLGLTKRGAIYITEVIEREDNYARISCAPFSIFFYPRETKAFSFDWNAVSLNYRINKQLTQVLFLVNNLTSSP